MNQPPVCSSSCGSPVWPVARRLLGSSLTTVAAPVIFGASLGIVVTPALAHRFFGGSACNTSNFTAWPLLVLASSGLALGGISSVANIGIELSDGSRPQKPQSTLPVGNGSYVVNENAPLVNTPPPRNLIKDICKHPVTNHISGAIWPLALFGASLCVLLDGSTCDLSEVNLFKLAWCGMLGFAIFGLIIHGYGVYSRHWPEKNLIADDEILLHDSDLEMQSVNLSQSNQSEKTEASSVVESKDKDSGEGGGNKVSGKSEAATAKEALDSKSKREQNPTVVVNPPQTLTPIMRRDQKEWRKNDNAMQFRSEALVNSAPFNSKNDVNAVLFSFINESENVSDGEIYWANGIAGQPVELLPSSHSDVASVDDSSNTSIDLDGSSAVSGEGEDK